MVSVCLVRSRLLIFNHVKEIHGLYAKRFGDSAKDRHFFKFHNDSRNMFVNTSKGIFFLIIFFSSCQCNSYGLKVLRNTEIKYLFHFKAYFYALDTFHISCLGAFKTNSINILE